MNMVHTKYERERRKKWATIFVEKTKSRKSHFRMKCMKKVVTISTLFQSILIKKRESCEFPYHSNRRAHSLFRQHLISESNVYHLFFHYEDDLWVYLQVRIVQHFSQCSLFSKPWFYLIKIRNSDGKWTVFVSITHLIYVSYSRLFWNKNEIFFFMDSAKKSAMNAQNREHFLCMDCK